MTYCECPTSLVCAYDDGKCQRCFRRIEPEPNYCQKCEGEGSYTELAGCTTFDKDCACNFERVTVDPCDVCGGSGTAPLPSREQRLATEDDSYNERGGLFAAQPARETDQPKET